MKNIKDNKKKESFLKANILIPCYLIVMLEMFLSDNRIVLFKSILQNIL